MTTRTIKNAYDQLQKRYDERTTVNGVTQDQAAALQGTDGSPSDTNRYVTDSDIIASYVPKDVLHANTLLKADVDHIPIELTVAASTIVGRGAAGAIEDLSPTEARTVLGLATGDTVVFGAVKTNDYQNADGTESLIWAPAETRWEFSDDLAVTGTLTASALTDGYIPYHVSDAAGLADGPVKADVDSAVSLKHGVNDVNSSAEPAGAVSTHAAVITGVHGLVITAGQTITVESSSVVNQDLTTDASPSFVTAKLSGLTDDYIPYHVNDATGLANGPTKTNVDSAVSLKHTQGTDTGTSNATFDVGGIKFFGKSIQLADHDTQVLTTVGATYPAHGFVQVCTTSAITESAEFEMGSDGTVNIIRGTSNIVANVDTTAKFCIGTSAAQNPLTIKNHLEATVQAIIQFWHG